MNDAGFDRTLFKGEAETVTLLEDYLTMRE
jgi:hypothetical protein